MFFKKSQKEQENIKNTQKEPPKKGIKKIDAVVTGAILGGVVASLYGVKKITEKDEKENEIQQVIPNLEQTKEKKGFFKRLFSRDK